MNTILLVMPFALLALFLILSLLFKNPFLSILVIITAFSILIINELNNTWIQTAMAVIMLMGGIQLYFRIRYFGGIKW